MLVRRISHLSFLWLAIVSAGAEVVTLTDPAGKFPEGKTLVWSPLFQASWDAMNAEIGGKPVQIEPPNAVMARLDAFDWDVESVMPESGWKVWGGEATEEWLARVNEEAAEMVGESPFTAVMPREGRVAGFGLLDRELEFEKEFFESKKAPLNFRAGEEAADVAFFGARGASAGRYGKSVRVLGHAMGWHAVELACGGNDEKVVLYLPDGPLDFAAACEAIRKLRAQAEPADGDPFLSHVDDLRIPYVSLDTKADFAPDLRGGRVYGNAGDPWRIVVAEQVTKFELFEKGAKVRVETSVAADPFGSVPAPAPPLPRKFIYDRPFFIFLWRDNAEWPYLGAWIGDSSTLRKF